MAPPARRLFSQVHTLQPTHLGSTHVDLLFASCVAPRHSVGAFNRAAAPVSQRGSAAAFLLSQPMRPRYAARQARGDSETAPPALVTPRTCQPRPAGASCRATTSRAPQRPFRSEAATASSAHLSCLGVRCGWPWLDNCGWGFATVGGCVGWGGHCEWALRVALWPRLPVSPPLSM